MNKLKIGVIFGGMSMDDLNKYMNNERIIIHTIISK